MITRHTTDAIRSPSLALHVPGGETYFGGCSCMLAAVGEASVVELADGCGMPKPWRTDAVLEEISHDEVAPFRGGCLAGASPFPAWCGEILGSATAR